MNTERRSFSWIVSSVLYRFSYIQIAHELDQDLLSYLGDRIEGMVVADCGCGPGVVVEKLIARGASLVLAIDGNGSMLRQVQARLPEAIRCGQVIPVQGRFDSLLFTQLQAGYLNTRGFDLILFKRSLYAPPQQSFSILQAAAATLQTRGCIVIIHPEPSVWRYAFGPRLEIRSYTPYHLLNRLASRLGQRLGLGEYWLLTQLEWIDLLRQAAPGLHVETIPSRQQSYILLAACAL